MPAEPFARDQAAHYLLVAHNTRAAAVEYLVAVTSLAAESETIDEVVDALLAAPNLLAALADPSASDPSVGGEAQGVLWMATRYALGRMTYAPSEVLDALREHAHRLHPAQRERMAGEIREAIDAGRAGWDCDVRVWRDALVVLADPPAPGPVPAADDLAAMVHRWREFAADTRPSDSEEAARWVRTASRAIDLGAREAMLGCADELAAALAARATTPPAERAEVRDAES